MCYNKNRKGENRMGDNIIKCIFYDSMLKEKSMLHCDFAIQLSNGEYKCLMNEKVFCIFRKEAKGNEKKSDNSR